MLGFVLEMDNVKMESLANCEMMFYLSNISIFHNLSAMRTRGVAGVVHFFKFFFTAFLCFVMFTLLSLIASEVAGPELVYELPIVKNDA